MMLFAVLAAIAVAVFLMVTLGERYLRPMSGPRQRQLQRLLLPLVGLALVLGAVQYYLTNS